MSELRIWELLARKYNGEISEEELFELNNLLQQPGEVVQLNELLEELRAIPLRPMTSEADEARSADKLKRLLKANASYNADSDHDQLLFGNRRKGIAVGLLSIAAVLLVLISAWILWLSNSEGVIAPESPALNEIVTNRDSKSTIYLPDGSRVILNTESRLSYNKDFGVSSRDITLNGEAYFDIAKNAKIPLIVHAGNVDIRVKGTVFNVRAYMKDSTVEASLIRGAIEVFVKNDQERKILLRPNEKILIGKVPLLKPPVNGISDSPDKEDVFTLGKLRPNPADSSISEIAWLENKLSFTREPFYSLAQKMERWFNVSIEFEENQLMEVTFTGSFEKESLIEALDALTQITPFRYKINNRKVSIRNAVKSAQKKLLNYNLAN